MIVQVYIINVYGNELVYPFNATATLLCRLKGTKTLDKSSLELIKALGYAIEVVARHGLGDL